MKYDLLKVKYCCVPNSVNCRWTCPYASFCYFEALYNPYLQDSDMIYFNQLDWMDNYCEMIYSEGEVDESSIF